ncbi:lysozyme inhibitor LprI family protein [Kosakonia sp. HypNH10]|uniref:lysozyme inhibitor LprI family protein n=1 Tax=Kosakonia sp. HypNH10 TaxID=2980101 RepID=UPI00244C0EFF|nr:lysozyme inhibitor LprI family protein [Kosakonia sp. HypNH10]MDH2912902.1 lysozyme inhibitor LprI family protein [Kosakonia sp. HypNH10]
MRVSLLSAIVMITAGMGLTTVAQAGVPETLKGDWRVVSGEPDNLATVVVNTKVDDPRYVGRVINFSNNAVTGELDGAVNCQQPAYTSASPMTLNEAIAKTSGMRNFAPKTPVAKDFGLKASGDEKITPILLKCQKGYLGPNGVSMDNWVALLSKDTLVMNWDDNSYFVLNRVKPGEKVSPGFSCSGNLNATEKTICSDNELASWDRSVSEAFRVRLLQQKETDPSDTKTLADIKSAQRTWLGKRNQCKSDANCLKKSMKERVEALVDESQ